MTQYVLVIVIVVMVWTGWFARRLWQAHDDVQSLRQRLANAQRGRRRALAWAALIGFMVVAMFMHWMHVNS